MSPYFQAWSAYHAHGDPDVPWNDLLTWHFHHGGIVSTPEAFIVARRVLAGSADEMHFDLSPLQFPEQADCWMVWLAAGNLGALLDIAGRQPLPWVSFTRRGETRIRRYRLQTIIRHGIAQDQSPEATAAGTAAGIRHRT